MGEKDLNSSLEVQVMKNSKLMVRKRGDYFFVLCLATAPSPAINSSLHLRAATTATAVVIGCNFCIINFRSSCPVATPIDNTTFTGPECAVLLEIGFKGPAVKFESLSGRRPHTGLMMLVQAHISSLPGAGSE